MSVFIARGVVAVRAAGLHGLGRFTYVAVSATDWYQWDGAHKAAHFASADDALAAAARCVGPWFNYPDPATIEAVSV